MVKFNFNDILKGVQAVTAKHSPEILTGIGIVGMVTASVLAVRATPKALLLIEEKKRKIKFEAIAENPGTSKDEIDLSPIEVVKTAWKCYIPSVVTGACSIACLVGASSVNARRNAALAAAYALSEGALSEYKDKVVETIGDKKEREIRDSIDQDRLDKNPVATKEIVITECGETLCYEHLSGRYFKSDVDHIRRAVNDLNQRLLFDTYISLNEFYEEIGLESIAIGDNLGWTVNPDSSDKGLIEIEFTSRLASDGTPCLVINFTNPPFYDYAH